MNTNDSDNQGIEATAPQAAEAEQALEPATDNNDAMEQTSDDQAVDAAPDQADSNGITDFQTGPVTFRRPVAAHFDNVKRFWKSLRPEAK